MRHLHFSYVVFILTFFLAFDCGAAKELTVQFPPDNSFVENELISVVIRIDKHAFDTIQVFTKEKKIQEITFDPDSDRTCFTIILKRGLNPIEFLGLKEGNVVGRNKVSVFFRSDLMQEFRVAPANFQRYFFHTADKEKSCTGCHEMAPTLGSLRPAQPDESPCYSCHSKKNANPFVHDPVAKWTCFTCHEVLEGERKYTTTKPDEKTCYPCHNSEIKEWKNKKTLHGPTAVGHCTLCHNPHSSNWPALLRMHTTDLCINCHQEKASGAHVVANFFGKGHPVRGVKDPFIPDREFSCAGCHNPHAGDTRNMLNHDTSSMTNYCSICHKM